MPDSVSKKSTARPDAQPGSMRRLTHLVRSLAPAHVILQEARKLMHASLKHDELHGPVEIGHSNEHAAVNPFDSVQAVWALAVTIQRLAIDNETLRRRLRRDNRRVPAASSGSMQRASKPAAAMMKNSNEQPGLSAATSGPFRDNGATHG